eukprot:jgi/Botrbrau1/4872/Bobra.0032s0028.1
MRTVQTHVALLLFCTAAAWEPLCMCNAVVDDFKPLISNVLDCNASPPPPPANSPNVSVVTLVPQDYPPEVLKNKSVGVPRPLPQKGRTGGTTIPSKRNICNSGTFAPVANSTLYTTFPYNSMGKFYFTLSGSTYACSSMLIARNLILTAVHCVFDCSTGTPIASGTFFDRFYNGEYVQFGRALRAAYYGLCDSFGLPLYDFAVVLLESNMADRTFPTTVKSTALALRNSVSAELYSYPAEFLTGAVPYLSTNQVAPDFPIPSQVEVDLSMLRGSSGSPFFVSSLPSNQYLVSSAIVGVTSYQYTGGGCPNGFAAFQPGWNPSELIKRLV